MCMNRDNRPPFKYGVPGVVYRMRGWRMVRKEGRKLFMYTGAN